MSNQISSDQAANRHSVLIAGAIVGAALILSWGMPRSTPKYQLAASGDLIVRLNTESGVMIACTPQRCARVATPRHGESFGPLTIEHDSKAVPALPKAEPPANAATP
jgi:hypothetical protein